MQIPILSGIYADTAPDFRAVYPRNLVPVPKDQGLSKGYLRPAEGIVEFATGPGVDRGGISWNGVCYRVMGTKLVRIDSGGAVTTIGDVGAGGQCSFDYSFDRLAVASGGRLYYWDGDQLTQVTDGDLGQVRDVMYVDGYFMTTDGAHLIVTELADPTQVNPLKYGSSELDADPIMRLLKLRNETHAVNRYTIEVFSNNPIDGESFPFMRNEGAQIHRGAIGTHAACVFDTGEAAGVAFLGSGRNEPPAVWFGAGGAAVPLSTDDIDETLQQYSEAQLSQAVVEPRIDSGHRLLLVHLLDRTLAYDAAASRETGRRVWHILDSSPTAGFAVYRARNLVWCYDRWLVGDPTSNKVGYLTHTTATHFGQRTQWEFSTPALYGDGRGAIVHSLELVGLPGYSALGDDPVVWCSHSGDGSTFSSERPARAGKRGQTRARIRWLRQGRVEHWRVYRFRGTSDVHMPFARLEAEIEPLAA